jgi:hypothetical protein
MTHFLHVFFPLANVALMLKCTYTEVWQCMDVCIEAALDIEGFTAEYLNLSCLDVLYIGARYSD